VKYLSQITRQYENITKYDLTRESLMSAFRLGYYAAFLRKHSRPSCKLEVDKISHHPEDKPKCPCCFNKRAQTRTGYGDGTPEKEITVGKKSLAEYLGE
jgi:hypothetical protein